MENEGPVTLFGFDPAYPPMDGEEHRYVYEHEGRFYQYSTRVCFSDVEIHRPCTPINILEESFDWETYG